MKKTLIAAGLFSLLPAVAPAQTNINIYGVLDTGLVKESGSDVRWAITWRAGSVSGERKISVTD